MKKKLLSVLMAAVLSISLVACGGEETTEAPAAETTVEAGDYTEEQIAFIEEYQKLIDDYNAAVDVFNANEELTGNAELVEVMNAVTEAIQEVDEICLDPSLLTEEAMELLRTTSFAETYKLIDEIYAFDSGSTEEEDMASTFASIFTVALCGSDEAGNTFYLLTDEEVTYAAFVMLSEDAERSMNVVGDVTENEDGTLTITEEEGRYLVIAVESIDEESLLLTLEDGTQATMVGWDVEEAIDFVLAIDEATEIVE
jgi:hypothetical protein